MLLFFRKGPVLATAAVILVPATPAFIPAIEGYAAYDPQDTCDPVDKPGVVDFRNLLRATYGSRTWLLATDGYGHRHALARRLGIMYIIWDRQIWSAHRVSEGRRPYTGPIPHTDHIHFSFSWRGANRQTTWWTGRADAPQPKTWIADVTGDGFHDLTGIKSDGTMWLFSNNFTRDGGIPYGDVRQIGHGWNNYPGLN